MITSVFSILLSISIINTGVINNQELGELQIPDTGFTQETSIQSSNSVEDSDFSYFLDVQLPQIKENTLREEQREADIAAAEEKARQEELARIEQEKIRIAQKIEQIRIQQEQEEAQRLQREAEERAAAEKQRQAAAAVATPANTDYVTHIRQRCDALGCNSDQVIRVMYCESGGRHDAYNASSGASGLFQHMPQYWASRAATYGVPGASIWDPHAQIIVSTGMFSQGLSYHWVCK